MGHESFIGLRFCLPSELVQLGKAIFFSPVLVLGARGQFLQLHKWVLGRAPNFPLTFIPVCLFITYVFQHGHTGISPLQAYPDGSIG